MVSARLLVIVTVSSGGLVQPLRLCLALLGCKLSFQPKDPMPGTAGASLPVSDGRLLIQEGEWGAGLPRGGRAEARGQGCASGSGLRHPRRGQGPGGGLASSAASAQRDLRNRRVTEPARAAAPVGRCVCRERGAGSGVRSVRHTRPRPGLRVARSRPCAPGPAGVCRSAAASGHPAGRLLLPRPPGGPVRGRRLATQGALPAQERSFGRVG